MKLIYRNTALLLLSLLLLGACNQAPCRRVASVFDEVESYINERPDSALAVLQGVDSTSLTTRALRARYSLLRTMALDKCYKDITVPGLLDPAVAWYECHGTADERMKALYYQGRIAQDNKDLNSSVIYYALAEEYVDDITDKHALGLLYLAEASVYNAVYNTDKEQEYTEKALVVFRDTNDPIYESSLGNLALVYHTRKDWEKADSLYREAIDHSDSYPHALSVFLSNYARMKLLRPDKDPEGTIELLNRKRGLSGGVLTPKEAGAYAYALALTGNNAASSKLKTQLQSLTGKARYDALPWLMRMSSLEGDAESANQYSSEMHSGEEAIVSEILSDSVTQALQDYYAQTAQQERERRFRQGLWALGSILFLLMLTLVLLNQSRFQKLRLTEKNKEKEELSAKLALYGTTVEETLDFSFDALNKLSDAFYHPNTAQQETFREIMAKYVSDVASRTRLGDAIEQNINIIHDDVITKLRTEVPALKEKDIKLFSLYLFGFSYKAISEFFPEFTSVNSVYSRVSRLRKTIAESGSAHTEFFLSFLERRPANGDAEDQRN